GPGGVQHLADAFCRKGHVDRPALLIAPPAARTGALSAWADRCVDIGEALAQAGEDAADPANTTRPDDLAYVIFTSGSTGKPK
ncbi:AMP-binding protein, partial [Xylella fastidiosa subsp. multiplex]|nr:AMP-binding protein [Xylella fastidiosa subsp. multiplex]